MKITKNLYSDFLLNFWKRYTIVLVFFLVIIVFSVIQPRFFSWTNIINILAQNSYIMIAAIGMAFVMISGGIDLSVGYQISLVGVLTTALMKWFDLPIWLSIIGGLTAGVIFGSFNGFLVNKLRVHSLIVTLGTMTIYQGASYLITKSSPIFDLSPAFKFIGQGYFLGIPFNITLTLIVAVLASIALGYTYIGRYVYALGGNEEASRLAGIDNNKMRVLVFATCGFLVGLSAIVLVSRAGSTNSSVGVGTEFTCITAAVLGGVSFKGGEGNIWGVCIGVLILGILSNGMQIIGLGIYPQYIAKGVILLAAISFDTYQKRTKEKVRRNELVEKPMGANTQANGD